MRLSSVPAALLAAIVGTAQADHASDLKSISPYLDSDMQSRWFDFGGDTIVRTDSYVASILQKNF
ncbi:hypothetical protein E5D57_006395 [Metarhizium anisopliae]|nr:hypothetical protein E5D57_006395 [Metarhizium anisopliae]